MYLINLHLFACLYVFAVNWDLSKSKIGLDFLEFLLFYLWLQRTLLILVEEAPEHHETNSAEHHGTKSTEHNETKSVEGNSSSQLNESAATNNEHVLKADDTTFGLESSAVLKTETSF